MGLVTPVSAMFSSDVQMTWQRENALSQTHWTFMTLPIRDQGVFAHGHLSITTIITVIIE